MNVIYAPRALRDLQGIGAYLLERSPSGAANVFAAIKSTVDALVYFRRSAV
jgi:plasmid stabilization system protein ParE